MLGFQLINHIPHKWRSVSRNLARIAVVGPATGFVLTTAVACVDAAAGGGGDARGDAVATTTLGDSGDGEKRSG